MPFFVSGPKFAGIYEIQSNGQHPLEIVSKENLKASLLQKDDEFIREGKESVRTKRLEQEFSIQEYGNQFIAFTSHDAFNFRIFVKTIKKSLDSTSLLETFFKKQGINAQQIREFPLVPRTIPITRSDEWLLAQQLAKAELTETPPMDIDSDVSFLELSPKKKSRKLPSEHLR